MQRFWETILDTLTGAAVASASVWVFNAADNSLATIYTDAAGASAAPNPLTSDSNGYIEFYAADGLYTLEFRVGDTSYRTITDIALYDLADLRADASAALAGLASKLSSELVSEFGLNLMNDNDAAAARTTLGLGTMATGNTTSYYTKDEVDGLIAGVEGGGVDLTNYYTKAEIDAGLADYYTKAEVDALIPEVPPAPTLYYHYGSFAVASITASEVLMDHIVATAHTLADDFAGCVASVGTNPAAVWTADVQKNGASIGSLQISAAGVCVFATTGAAVAVAVGDVITLVAPAGADASLARLRFTFRGVI